MFQCSDIEGMLRAGAGPASSDERLACLSHLESCTPCRRALEATGVGIATVAGGPPPATIGDLTQVADSTGGDPIAPTIAGRPRPSGPGSGDVSTQVATGSGPRGTPSGSTSPDPYATLTPTEDDAFRTRLGDAPAGSGEASRSRSRAGFDTEPCPESGRADPSWPRVPGHELVAKLGEGGMGVVYKARQVRLNRMVALKMIRGDGRAGELQLERFRIEAEAVARVHHPNIVQIYEIGDLDGLPYLSLELLEGGGLDAKLAGRPRPCRESAEMVAALSSAVEAAHRARIIHRDLKPANVVLAADGTPKVTDFGLAKRLEEDDSRTNPGDVMGSPSYMSPEQARGEVHLVGPATDVYSLGAILYEMLTGRPPFRGASARDTVRQVIEEEPVPPSRLQPRLSRDLETIALKCLEKGPARRYPTAAELGDDLRRFLGGEPIRARPIAFWERGLKWARRRPATATLSAVAASALVGIVGASIWYGRLVAERARLEADRVEALVSRGREILSEGREQYAQDLGAATTLFSQLGRSLAEGPPAALSDPRVVALREQAALGLARAGEARRSRDRGAAFRGRLARFRRLRDEALFLDTSFDGLQESGRGRDPESGGRKALEALGLTTRGADDGSRSLEPLPPEATPAERSEVITGSYGLLLILAEAEARRPDPAGPKARDARALRVLDSAPRLAPDVPETRAYHLRRVDRLLALGDEAGAALERERLAGSRPGDAFDRFLYGRELYKQGRPADAIPEFRAARMRDPDLFWARALLAISYARSGRPAEARIVLDECLQDRPGFAWLYLLRGYASGLIGSMEARRDPAGGKVDAFAAFDERPARAGGPSARSADFEAAEEDFREALARLGPADDGLRYTLHLDRGFVRLWDSRLAEAAADFEEAIRVDPARFNAYVNLAGVRFRQGDLDGAIARLTEALGRTPDGPGAAGALRFRALVHERKSARFGLWADRDEAIRAQVPREVAGGIALAPGWVASTCRAIEAQGRRAALADLSAIRHGPSDRPEEVASDLAHQARSLREAGRAEEALEAAERALAADPNSSEANRLRIEALSDRGLHDRAIAACDAAMAGGVASAELFAIRGKARARVQDLAGAIRDFDRSLALRADQPRLLIDRGWAYLFYGFPGGAPRLALDDFERAIRLDPGIAEAYSGRGNARAALGLDDLAVADADLALRLDPRSVLNRVRCARIYAAAADASAARVRREKGVPAPPGDHSARALALLRGAILAQPTERRLSYYERTIRPDDAFRAIRRDRRLGPILREAIVADPSRSHEVPQGRP